MYDIVIVGAGIAGLNAAKLLNKKNKKICIIEKSDRIGGLIHTKYMNIITKKNSKNNNKNKTRKINIKNKKRKVKYEAGGAVVYSYQKNMMNLIKEFDIKIRGMPIDNKTDVNRHYKDFWDCKPRKKPLDTSSVNKFFKLIKKLFDYMEKKGDNYCRKFTLEQIALEILTFEEIRFLEFCYGYAAEFRLANSVVAKKNINNELFNTDKIYVFEDGYSFLNNAIYNSIKNDVTLKTNCYIKNFNNKSDCIELQTNKSVIKCKKLIFAIPREALLNMCDSFTKNEIDLFNSVIPFSLNRIFAKYDVNKKINKWMKKINFSTVNNPIRQIIPLKKDVGVFQISYSDWYFADYWGNLKIDNLKKILKKLLSETFQYEKIDKPEKILRYYWKNACHFWKPNINEKLLYKKILHLRKNIFVIGESFSLNQGWAEGAVQTSIDVCKIID